MLNFEITQIIIELENGKSSDIPIEIIKRENSIVSPILALNFNYLMKIGKFLIHLRPENNPHLQKRGRRTT